MSNWRLVKTISTLFHYEYKRLSHQETALPLFLQKSIMKASQSHLIIVTLKAERKSGDKIFLDWN